MSSFVALIGCIYRVRQILAVTLELDAGIYDCLVLLQADWIDATSLKGLISFVLLYNMEAWLFDQVPKKTIDTVGFIE